MMDWSTVFPDAPVRRRICEALDGRGVVSTDYLLARVYGRDDAAARVALRNNIRVLRSILEEMGWTIDGQAELATRGTYRLRNTML